MNFIINNQENFQTDSSIHSINTKNKQHRHKPNANLSCFQKSTFSAGIKIFDSLQPSVTTLKSDRAKILSILKNIPKYTLPLLCSWMLMCKDDFNTFW